jgi:hypothetical protein
MDGDQGAFGQHLLLKGFPSTDDESGSARKELGGGTAGDSGGGS